MVDSSVQFLTYPGISIIQGTLCNHKFLPLDTMQARYGRVYVCLPGVCVHVCGCLDVRACCDVSVVC